MQAKPKYCRNILIYLKLFQIQDEKCIQELNSVFMIPATVFLILKNILQNNIIANNNRIYLIGTNDTLFQTFRMWHNMSSYENWGPPELLTLGPLQDVGAMVQAIRYSCTHPFSPSVHAYHLNILSDSFYSPAPFLFQLFNAPLYSKLYSSVAFPPNFSNLHLKNIHFPSLSTSHIPHAAALCNAFGIQLLSHIDNSLHLCQFFIAHHTFQRSSRFIPLNHCVYHITFISSIRCHLRSQALKTIYFRQMLTI